LKKLKVGAYLIKIKRKNLGVKDDRMTFVAGIDLGSRNIKVLILDKQKRIRGKAMKKITPLMQEVAEETLAAALKEADLNREDLAYIATTGFGRKNIPFRDIQFTDVTSDAKGSTFLFPSTDCVLDIGFQSTRAIKLKQGGKVKFFQSNDKCAAGAGGFLERIANYLEIKLEDLGEMSLKADSPGAISSVCAVLAESEIINHITQGQSTENIIRGIHDSLASRAQTLLRKVNFGSQLTFVGGVAKQRGMKKALEETLKVKVHVPKEPQFTAVLGAALWGLRRMEKICFDKDIPRGRQTNNFSVSG
jgi:predicted CoA-substrate-specific enzyme activase